MGGGGGGGVGGLIGMGGPPQMGPGSPFGPLYLRKHNSPLDSPPSSSASPTSAMLNAHRLGGGGGGGHHNPWNPHLPYFPALPHHSPLVNFNRSPFLNPAAAASYLPGAPSFQNLLAHLNVAAAAQQMNQQLPPGHPFASLNAAELLLQHSMAAAGGQQAVGGSSSHHHHHGSGGGGMHSPIGGSTASPHFSPTDDSSNNTTTGQQSKSSGGRKSISPREGGGGGDLNDESSDSDFRVISPHSDDGSNKRNSSINSLRVKAKEHAEALRAIHNNSADVVTTN
jgi:hypothetical protein